MGCKTRLRSDRGGAWRLNGRAARMHICVNDVNLARWVQVRHWRGQPIGGRKVIQVHLDFILHRYALHINNSRWDEGKQCHVIRQL